MLPPHTHYNSQRNQQSQFLHWLDGNGCHHTIDGGTLPDGPAGVTKMQRNNQMSKTFRGVVFHGPRDVRVEDRPFPDIKDWSENDAIVQVIAAGMLSAPLIIFLPHLIARSDNQDCVGVISTVCPVRSHEHLRSLLTEWQKSLSGT